MGAFFFAQSLRTSKAQQGAQTHRIVIEKFKFVPERLTIKKGDTVEWINRDFVPHIATAKDKSWESANMAKDEIGKVTLSKLGSHPYICRYHPHMIGEIIVNDV